MTNLAPDSDSLSPQVAARDAALLAPYAMACVHSAGRHYPESCHPYRSPYQRDRDRIVHCAAFRRLSHKTQVFTGDQGDYHRSRLTHTLEVASIARTIARQLKLNEDLTEALALLHDIGHPPFGHAGEAVLNECLADEGCFEHNDQALRIVEFLEVRYPYFPGLNLSREVLEGQTRRAASHQTASQAVDTAEESPLLEVQAVDAADSIAYDTHDADDALELGLIELPEILELPLWRDAARRVHERYSTVGNEQLRSAIVRDLIDRLVSDVLANSLRRIADWELQNVADVRRAPIVIGPGQEVAEQQQALESFLFERVYRHPDLLRRRAAAQHALRQLFRRWYESPASLPAAFLPIVRTEGQRRAVVDYLASLTDRGAWHAVAQPEPPVDQGWPPIPSMVE